jgi:hypothetical protein
VSCVASAGEFPVGMAPPINPAVTLPGEVVPNTLFLSKWGYWRDSLRIALLIAERLQEPDRFTLAVH